jgi:hypothetical protein
MDEIKLDRHLSSEAAIVNTLGRKSCATSPDFFILVEQLSVFNGSSLRIREQEPVV